MRIYEALSPQINRVIGQIGFDKITLSNLVYEKEYPQPIDDYFTNKNVLDSSIAGHTIYRTSRKAIIYGPGYELSFGTHGRRPFSRITLHVSDEEKADNLSNMSLDQVKEKLASALADVHAYCGLDFDDRLDMELVRVYKAEINITVPISRPYNDYRRILRLMESLYDHKDGTAEYMDQNGVLQTVYLLSGRTKNTDIYDKRAELEQTKDPHVDCDCNLLRYEIKGSEQALALMSTDPYDKIQGHYLLHLANITTESMESFFLESTTTLFEKMDTYLRKETDFSFRSCSNLHAIQTAALKVALRMDPAGFIEKILMQYAVPETTGHPLTLLDIQDLVSSIGSSDMDPECQRLLTESLNDIATHPKRYDEACSAFLDQREIYNELHEKLCSSKVRYEMSMLSADDQCKYLVWWQNPSHKKLEIPDHDETLFEWQLAQTRPTGWQNADIMVTSNRIPIYYLRQDRYEYHRSKTGPVLRSSYRNTEYMIITNEMWDAAKRAASANETEWEDQVIADYEARKDAGAIMGDVDPSFYGI